MKTFNKFKTYILSVGAAFALQSCGDFVDINTDTGSVREVDPVGLLYQVEKNYTTYQSTWDDSYAARLRWMQYCTGIWGYNLVNFTWFNSRLGATLYKEYIEVGSYASHIEYLVSQKPKEEADKYTDLINVARIILISKGIATSDTHGSLTYHDGWGFRKDDESIKNPKFETQEALYDAWDQELKQCAENIKNSKDQISLQGYDLVYNGEAKQWIKAANAMRLRIALRLLKRDEAKAKQIAKEVLNSTIPLNIDDSFIMYFDKIFTSGGDWHSVIDMDRASTSFMTYLKKYDDPRKRLYFQINNLTKENIEKFNTQETEADKKIPLDYTRWEGGTASYDSKATDHRYIYKKLEDGTDMRAANKPQTRLWKGMQDGGSGGSWFPILTYADFCFMAAEFTHLGVANIKSAKEWYEEGVKSSIRQWSNIGEYCMINDYEKVSDEEIETFMNQEGIAWDESKALQLIYAQTYVEHYKNNNEAWALWKRTGYPNTESDIIQFEKILVKEEVQTIPRRVRFLYPAEGSPNYENALERIKTMEKDPEFGRPDDEFGRLWWDKK